MAPIVEAGRRIFTISGSGFSRMWWNVELFP
jgi:hypothetical protein